MQTCRDDAWNSDDKSKDTDITNEAHLGEACFRSEAVTKPTKLKTSTAGSWTPHQIIPMRQLFLLSLSSLWAEKHLSLVYLHCLSANCSPPLH